jgi:nicotinamidase-related amidase
VTHALTDRSVYSNSMLGAGDALLLIDVQNDFLPGGTLPVPDGDAVIAPLNAWIGLFTDAGCPIFAVRDCHPANHCSFRAHGGPWPPHCVAHSPGARAPDSLVLPAAAQVIDKPGYRDRETYSGFTSTALDACLRRAGIRRLWVGGLATDYCVLSTVSEALDLGYAVMLLAGAMRAVDARPGDGARAIARMVEQGAVIAGEPS